MKKLFFVLLAGVLLVAGAGWARAEEEIFYCDCSGAGQKINGQSCVTFNSSTIAQAVCPVIEKGCVLDIKPPGDGVSSDGLSSSENNCVPFTGKAPKSADDSGSDSAKTIKLNNPLAENQTDISAIIGNIIKAALGIMGALVLLMIVWGGSTWLFAVGNPEKIKSGSKTIMWAILGAMAVLGSYILLEFVLLSLSGPAP